MTILIDTLTDALLDTAKLIPFLFLTYLAMEFLEDRAGEKTLLTVRNTRRFGPLIGAFAGLLPQCGFSAAASGLYAGGVITAGTLLAIFLSTSDEMLPILLSESVPLSVIARLLLCKLVPAVLTGAAIDILTALRRRVRPAGAEKHIHDLCEQDHCGCEEGNILTSALRHTAQVVLFIFVITFAAGLAMEFIGEENAAAFLTQRQTGGVFLAALAGLIPNCGASVMITELYLEGILSTGQMLAGLLVGAGVGLLVLFRSNRHLKENLCLTGILYASGVFWGLLFTWLHITV